MFVIIVLFEAARLVLTLQSSCLCLSSAGIAGVHNHAWLILGWYFLIDGHTGDETKGHMSARQELQKQAPEFGY